MFLDYLFLLTLASIMLWQLYRLIWKPSASVNTFTYIILCICFFFNAEEKLTNMFLFNFFSRLFLNIQKLPKVLRFIFFQSIFFISYFTYLTLLHFQPPINSWNTEILRKTLNNPCTCLIGIKYHRLFNFESRCCDCKIQEWRLGLIYHT